MDIFDLLKAPASQTPRLQPISQQPTGDIFDQLKAGAAAVQQPQSTQPQPELSWGERLLAMPQVAGLAATRFVGGTIPSAALGLTGRLVSEVDPVLGGQMQTLGRAIKEVVNEEYSPAGFGQGAVAAELEANKYGALGVSEAVGSAAPAIVATLANPTFGLGLIGTTTAGESADRFEAELAKHHPDMDPDTRRRTALGLGAANGAIQAAIERFGPFQKLARGNPAAGNILMRLAMTMTGEGRTEASQQLVEELISLGINPNEEQVWDGLRSIRDAYYFGAASGGVMGGGVEIANAAGNFVQPGRVQADPSALLPQQQGDIFDMFDEGPATAEQLRAVDAFTEPTLPPSIERATIKSREGDTKGQVIDFATPYDKAKYIADRPDFRGPMKDQAIQYVSDFDRYRQQSEASNVPTEVDRGVAAPATLGPESTPPVSGSGVSPVPVGQTAVEGSVAQLQPDVRTPDQTTGRVKPTVTRRLATIERAKATMPEARFDLPPLNRDQVQMKKGMEDRGLDVVFYDQGEGKGFVRNSDPGVLFINRQQPVESARIALLHEFGHELRNNHPDLWAELSAAVSAEQRAAAQAEAARRDAGEGADYTAGEADVIPLEAIANNPRVVRALQRQKPTVWQRIVETFRRFVDFVRGTKNPLLDRTVKLLEDSLGQPLYSKEQTIRDASPAPNDDVRNVALRYAESYGRPAINDTEYVKVDEARAKRIAEWYENAQHQPNDPAVKASYDALIKETKQQYEAIQQAGYKLEPWTGDGPAYKSSADMMADVKNNKHLYFDPTAKAFGPDGQALDHPMLAEVEVGGQKMVANDLFRAVHDFFGHAKEGVGFGPRGEENAWRQHSLMFSEAARPAMTAETRGQNSWVNYGPHGEANRANPANTIFAEQKATLAPDWVVEDGASFMRDEEVYPTKYGYWFFPGKGMIPVHEAHEPSAREQGYKDTFDALKAGAVRVVARPGSIEVNIEAYSPEDLGGIKSWVQKQIAERKNVRVDINTEGETFTITSMEAFNKLAAGDVEGAKAAKPRLQMAFFNPSIRKPTPDLKDRVQDVVRGDTETKPKTVVREAREAARGETSAQASTVKDVNYEFSEAVRTEFGRSYEKLTPKEKAGLLAALKGSPIPFVNYGSELQVAITRMRDMIDNNTDTLIAQLKAAGNKASLELAKVLQQNRGQYANLSYQLFEKPQKQIDRVMAGKGVYARIKSDYEAWVEGELRASGLSPTPAQVEGAMRQILLDIAGQGPLGPAMTGQGLTVNYAGAKPTGILKHRKSLPAELRAAMGQNISAPIVFQTTVAKQAAMIAAHKFQQIVKDAGLNKWLFKEPVGEFAYRIAREGDPRSPLSDLYTTKEVAELFAQSQRELPNTIIGHVLRGWRKVAAVSRLNVTVGSTAAAGANYISQPLFLLANGVINPKTYLRVFLPGKVQLRAMLEDFPIARRVLDAVWSDAGRTSPAVRAEIEKYNRLGLLGDSVFARDALDAARELGLDPNTLGERGTLDKLIEAGNLPIKFAKAIYNLSDSRTRLLIFEKELNVLKKANPTASIESLEIEAADRAKNLYPSHERAWQWSKDLSRTGVVGPFAPFTAEIVRTATNGLRYGLFDAIEGAKRMRAGDANGKHLLLSGISRYIGITALITGSTIIARMLTATLGGLDEDEEKRLRKFLAPWLRYKTGFFVKKGDGEYQYYDMARYAPFLALPDAVLAAMDEGLIAGGWTAASPFISEQLVTTRVLDASRNRTTNGGQVYNEEDTPEDKAEKVTKHLLGPMIPDIVKRPLGRIIPAFQGATDRSGKPLDPEDELLRAVGLTITTVDTKAALERKALEHDRRSRNAHTLFTSALSSLGTAEEQDVVKAYNKMEDARFRVWKDTYDAVRSARDSGVPEQEIIRRLRLGPSKSTEPEGMNIRDIRALLRGEYLPYNFAKNAKYAFAREKHPDKVPQGKLFDEMRLRRQQRLD